MLKKYKILSFLLVFSAFIFLCYLLFSSDKVKAPFITGNKKPNVILISIDTLRPDHLKSYGYKYDTSPNITRWAKENPYIMQNAYTLTPMTYPSFTSLMTGRSPFDTHIYNNGRIYEDKNGKLISSSINGFNEIPNTVPTIATILKGQGYLTAAFSENSALRNKGTDIGKGFDEYQVYGEIPAEQGITDSALDWLDEKVLKGNPFFLWVHYIGSHEAFTPQGENSCLFNKRYCNVIKAQTIPSLALDEVKQEGCHFSPLSDEQIGVQESLYDGEIYQTDSSVGKLLSFIEENNLDKNSIIILYSDHGEGFDHNFYFTHSQVLYESSLKIMLMISLPGVKAHGKELLTPVTNSEVYPTLGTLLGWNIKGYAGSFANLLTSKKLKESSSPTNPIFYVNESADKFAIRKGEYKYIYNRPSAINKCISQKGDELYNVVTDPDETKNLTKEIPDLRDSLMKILLDHIDSSKIISGENSTPMITQPVTKEDEEVLRNIRNLGY